MFVCHLKFSAPLFFTVMPLGVQLVKVSNQVGTNLLVGQKVISDFTKFLHFFAIFLWKVISRIFLIIIFRFRHQSWSGGYYNVSGFDRKMPDYSFANNFSVRFFLKLQIKKQFFCQIRWISVRFFREKANLKKRFFFFVKLT